MAEKKQTDENLTKEEKRVEGSQSLTDTGVAQTNIDNPKVDIPLVDPYEFGGQTITNLTIRRPVGDDFRGLNIGDVMRINGRALEVILPKIVTNTILDAAIIRKMTQANLLAIVEGINLFIDTTIKDYEDFALRTGNVVAVTLPVEYGKNGKVIQKFTMRLPQSGELRGYNLSDLLNQNFETISGVAPRCMNGVDLDKKDIRRMPIENIAVLSYALTIGLEDEGKERPKMIAG